MTAGGARTRSGPPPKENSGRSDKRGYRLGELPAEGYDGPVPKFPLAAPNERELQVWSELWTSPQAVLWAMPGQSWRHMGVGLYVRQVVKCEAPDIGAGQIAQLHRFADQIGVTPAGLAALGWKIVASEEEALTSPAPRGSRSRLRGVPNVGKPTSSLEAAKARAAAKKAGNGD